MIRLYLFLFTASVFSISALDDLPNKGLVKYLAVASCLVIVCCYGISRFATGPSQRKLRVAANLLLMVTAGFTVGIWSGYGFLTNQLNSDLYKRELLIEGLTQALPIVTDDHATFELLVVNAREPIVDSGAPVVIPRIVRLTLYQNPQLSLTSLKPNQRWRFLVKLKPVRGLVNFSIQDTDISTLRRGIGAFGTVQSNGFANDMNKLLADYANADIDRIRFNLRAWIASSTSRSSGLLVALAIGDTSAINAECWRDYLKTGTNHLIAISGLHVGFFALIGYVVGLSIGRLLQLAYHPVPAQVWAKCIAFLLTLFYCAVAGFSIPTVRTLIMLAVLQLLFVARRRGSVVDALFLALAIVSIYDPLAAFDRGFWLSFIAVGILMFYFFGRFRAKQVASVSSTRTSIHRFIVEPVKVFGMTQWALFIGLLLPLSLLVHSVSITAPIANIIATPVITFIVVPLLILASVVHEVGVMFHASWVEWVAYTAIHGADYAAFFTQWFLHAMVVNVGDWNTVNFAINPWALPLLLLGVFLFLLPEGLKQKYLGLVLMCAGLFILPKAQQTLEMLVFDVGQGTSVLIQTQHHRLLYDTGPQFSKRSGTAASDAGARILLPFFQAEGIAQLDTVVISHDDLDHSGGYASLAANMKIGRLLAGQPEKWNPPADTISGVSSYSCHETQAWDWDGVTFKFIELAADTPLTTAMRKDNNRSCILEITYKNQRILLPGDIEKELEAELIRQNQLLPSTILLAPHHGSHSSSSQPFVDTINPEWVIYSAAYMSQHGHPHQDIQSRYVKAGASALNTTVDGAVRFSIDEKGSVVITKARELQRHFWYR